MRARLVSYVLPHAQFHFDRPNRLKPPFFPLGDVGDLPPFAFASALPSLYCFAIASRSAAVVLR